MTKEKTESATCHICGCTSPLTEFFRKTRKGLICPRCMPREGLRDTVKLHLLLLSIGVIASFLTSRGLGYVRWWPALHMLVLIAVLWLTIISHELIHALAARFLGGHVFEVALGMGQILYSVRLWGTRFSLRQGLLFGLCLAAFRQRRLVRVRWLIYIMAPLSAQILFIVWLWPRIDFRRLDVVEAALLVNIILVAANLFPRKLNAILATDGYHLWEFLRGKKSADELHAAYFLIDSSYDFEYGAYASMLTTAQAGIALYPENELLKNQVAAAYLVLDEHAKALQYFDRFLAQEASTDPTPARGILQNNRAFALFCLALEPEGISPESMESAHESIGEAFHLLPWVVPIEVVRAISFGFQGHHRSAVKRLEKLIPLQERDGERATSYAFIGLAQHAMGEIDAARATLDRALALDKHDDRTLANIGRIIMTDETGAELLNPMK